MQGMSSCGTESRALRSTPQSWGEFCYSLSLIQSCVWSRNVQHIFDVSAAYMFQHICLGLRNRVESGYDKKTYNPAGHNFVCPAADAG